MNDNILNIKDEFGNDILIDVIDIIKDNELNKEYICYTLKDDSAIFISSLVKHDDSYSLETITEEERETIENILSGDTEE